jgi:hypothetical protein
MRRERTSGRGSACTARTTRSRGDRREERWNAPRVHQRHGGGEYALARLERVAEEDDRLVHLHAAFLVDREIVLSRGVGVDGVVRDRTRENANANANANANERAENRK